MTNAIAEVFPPGVFIKEELDERGWSQADFAEIIGKSARLVSEVVSGSRTVSVETAKAIGDAFDSGPEVWLNLQSAYDLYRAATVGDDVSRRSRLYSLAPIREMVKRGWIEKATNVDILETQYCDFFRVSSVDEDPGLAHAARKSAPLTSFQTAWLYRARRLAEMVDVDKFSQEKVDSLAQRLRTLMGDPEEARRVPETLAGAGIRFVVVEHLPKTRIDGACFWLDEKSPVVAVSIRFDRIDSFWHTVCHEVGHVKHGHAQSMDEDVGGGDLSDTDEDEKAADLYAENVPLDSGELDLFIDRVGPLYSHQKILGFAKIRGIHPGIVVGQLQHRKVINFSHSRKFLVKIRNHVTATALTDGWGAMAPL